MALFFSQTKVVLPGLFLLLLLYFAPLHWLHGFFILFDGFFVFLHLLGLCMLASCHVVACFPLPFFFLSCLSLSIYMHESLPTAYDIQQKKMLFILSLPFSDNIVILLYIKHTNLLCCRFCTCLPRTNNNASHLIICFAYFPKKYK